MCEYFLFDIMYYKVIGNERERPYNDDSTASRLLSEVKHRLARLVLRWGTTLESLVLFSFCFIVKYNEYSVIRLTMDAWMSFLDLQTIYIQPIDDLHKKIYFNNFDSSSKSNNFLPKSFFLRFIFSYDFSYFFGRSLSAWFMSLFLCLHTA